MSLDINLLGGLCLRWNNVELPPLATEKSRALCAFLAAHPEQSHDRGRLASLLWADLPERRARRRLSQELWRLRTHLDQYTGQSFILTVGGVRLDPSAAWTVDIHCFANECDTVGIGQRTALSQAVARYRGDLLPELDDEWVYPLREQLRERYLAALATLIELEKQAGVWDSALRYALALTKADPLSEAGQRQVMQIYGRLGRIQAGLDHFERFAALLHAELDAAPTPATLQLADSLRGQITQTVQPVTPPFLSDAERLPLVGREEERATLLAGLERMFAGFGGLILVEGEAGAGKSRLLAAMREDAGWRGALVAQAVASRTPAQPYAHIAAALGPFLTPLRLQQLALLMEPLWLAVTASILPGVATALSDLSPPPPLDGDDAQQRQIEGFVRLFQAAGNLAPLLLILDDLHRTDVETLALLPALARRLADHPVLVVAAYRDDEIRSDAQRWQAIQAADRAGLRRRLFVKRLPPPAVDELVRHALGMDHAAPHLAARIHHETDGNPLFVLESLRALIEDDRLRRNDEGEWFIAGDEELAKGSDLLLPDRIETLIDQRIRRLSDDARALLRPAAVVGRTISLPLLQKLSPLTPRSTLAAAQELVRRQFWVETEADYRFGHDKFQEVVYQALPISLARRLHRRVGQTLAELGESDHGQLAWHFEEGQAWAQAARHHLWAGLDSETKSAYAAAFHHLQRTLHLAADRPLLERNERWQALLHTVACADVLGEQAAEDEALAQLAALAETSPEKAEVLRRQAHFLAKQSKYDQAQALAQQGLALARQTGQPDTVAAALTVLGTVYHLHGECSRAITFLQEAAAVPGSSVLAQAAAFVELATAYTGTKEYAAARGASVAALDRYGETGSKAPQAGILNSLGIVSAEEGLYEQAAHYYQQAIDLSQAIGYRYGELRGLINLANVHNKTGQIGAAIDGYQAALAVNRHLGNERAEAITAINLASTLMAFVGDYPAACSLLRPIVDYAERVGDEVSLGHALSILASVEINQAHWQAARPLMDAARDHLSAAGEYYILAQFHRTRATWFLRNDDIPAALAEVDASLELCQQYGMEAVGLWVRSQRGLIQAQAGQVDAGLAAIEESVAKLDQIGESDYVILYHYYRVLQAAGQPERARTALVQAHARLEKMLATLSEEQQALSRAHVPEHREILDAWREQNPESDHRAIQPR